jgi:parallel beta-helix repeat protein
VNENTITDNKVDGVNLYKCNRVSVSGNVLLRNVVGVYFYNCFDCTIAFNYISNHSREGVKVANSQNIAVSENTMLGNGRAALGLFYSSNSVVESNVLDRNTNHGIWLDNSSDVILAGNNVTSNEWDGIYLHVSSSCAVTDNLVAGNMNGLHFWVADNNTVTNNIVKENNNYGMYLEDCVRNAIFHNSFSNNTRQVGTLGKCKNSWDDGYPSGGNYWSDYAGVDFYNGPFQNLTGSDGIGDAPYVIDEENLDRYPLMTPHRVHDVSVVEISMISSKIYVGWVVDVNVAVKNVGGYIESFSLSAFWDNVLLGVKTVKSLHVGETVVLGYVWNTTGVVPCRNYTVKVLADGVPDETDLENNVCMIEVKVDMMGDVNGDGKVNIVDIFMVAKAFGSHMGDQRYRLDCDFNRDDVINIADIWSIAKNFGKKCSV